MNRYEDETSSGIDYFNRLMRGGGDVPLPPKTTNPNPAPPKSGGSSSGGSNSGGSTSGTGSKKGSSSKSANSYQSYLNAQKAEQRKAQNKAARRYVGDAEALRGQARALLTLLGRNPNQAGKGGGPARGKGPGPGGIKGHIREDHAPGIAGKTGDGPIRPGVKDHLPKGGKGGRGKDGPVNKLSLRDELRVKLGNATDAYQRQDKLLTEQYGERLGSLQQSDEDNEVAAAGQTVAALSNRQRERANALSEVTLQGGGESDALRAQQMSLRNWSANQQEINRNYQDTLSSINASVADLTADTKTARQSALGQYNSDRELLWTNFYDAKAETLTQLGNTYGQMGEYYGLANEQVGRKKYRRRQRRLNRQSSAAFMDAAHAAGSAWDAPTDTKISNWQGAADFEGGLNNGQFAAAPTELARPEGASLRRWDA